MKKIVIGIIAILFLYSCGPKRMSCYGKRCVESSKNITVPKFAQKNRNS